MDALLSLLGGAIGGFLGSVLADVVADLIANRIERESTRFEGKKYLGPDGNMWKVVGVAFVDDRVYVWLRRTWRPFSRDFRYAVGHDDGSIAWIMKK